MKITTESSDTKKTYDLQDRNVITVSSDLSCCFDVLFQTGYDKIAARSALTAAAAATKAAAAGESATAGGP